MNTGDIVRVTRTDGRTYDCFVVEDYKSRGMFYGKVLKSSKDKVACSSWSRYGTKEDGILQIIDECKSVTLMRPGRKTVLEDMDNTCIYQNKDPKSNETITFCLSEGFGGWSNEDDEGSSILESFNRTLESKREVLRDAN